jgi:tetratricopeptide (TPR) repeat protein
MHGSLAAAALTAWVLHLARVLIQWLESGSRWGLLLRPGDFLEMARGAAWGFGFGRTPPRRGRFNYRERFSYTVFLSALPLMAVTGLAFGQPARFHGLLGNGGLMAAASLHAGLGLGLVLVLAWHLFFALLQPGMLWMNLSWITGRLPWEKVERVRPDWAAEILGGFGEETVLSAPEPDEAVSAEDLLNRGNEAARQGKFRVAVQFYDQALALYPGYSQALFNLGVALCRLNERDRAREVLQHYLAEDQFGSMSDQARMLLRRLGVSTGGSGGAGPAEAEQGGARHE